MYWFLLFLGVVARELVAAQSKLDAAQSQTRSGQSGEGARARA
jgi:hypothetical protein